MTSPTNPPADLRRHGVGDIDFLARTLRVTRQLQRAKAADVEAGEDLVDAAGGIVVMIRPPKYESERTIYLPDELVTILSGHVRQHATDGEPSRWLFDEDGKPWRDNLLDYRWRSTRTDAGVSFKLHELRHYFASGLIAAGCDVDGSASDGPRVRHHHAEHLRAPMADRRGQDQGCRFGNGGGCSCHASATHQGSIGL